MHHANEWILNCMVIFVLIGLMHLCLIVLGLCMCRYFRCTMSSIHKDLSQTGRQWEYSVWQIVLFDLTYNSSGLTINM